MKKVGIPNAENRYDDYPFQYSGGMRQRIVIAIALSCQPKILIVTSLQPLLTLPSSPNPQTYQGFAKRI